MAKIVFDASAVIALLREEPGADIVASYIGEALISAVNLQEVIKALLVRGFELTIIKSMIDALHLEVRSHDVSDAYAAAALHRMTMIHGSGIGNRTCMALAIKTGLPVLTTDLVWSKLSITGLHVKLAR